MPTGAERIPGQAILGKQHFVAMVFQSFSQPASSNLFVDASDGLSGGAS